MITFGLIGYPLSHSSSAFLFENKLSKEGRSGYRYENFPLASLSEFPSVIRNYPALKGLNVTVPYKEEIIPWLEDLDPKAKKIGAVNTILIRHERGNIHMKGFNTDADGFRQSADFTGTRKALILGTGGGAKAVAYALKEMGWSVLFVSRTKKSKDHIVYEDLSEEMMRLHPLIVNATPLGMLPDVETCPPIPYQFLTGQHFLYDLVYNPAMTLFLKKGSDAGTRIQNGQKMLEIQAELSYRIWNEG
jgi:shikimate dehydrogenase